MIVVHRRPVVGRSEARVAVPEAIGQRRAAAGDAGAHRAGRDAEHRRDVGVVHADEIPQRDRGAVFGRQRVPARRRRRDGRRRRRRSRRVGVGRDLRERLDGDRPATPPPRLRRARRSSRRGTPTSRTATARRTGRSGARSRAAPLGSRRARRRGCRGCGGTPRGSTSCGDGAAHRGRRPSPSAALAASCSSVSASSLAKWPPGRQGRSIQAIPTVRGPVCTPTTGPIVPTTTSASPDERLELREELVDVGRVGVQHADLLDLPRGNTVEQELQSLGPGSHLRRRLDRAVGDGDDRLDRQHRSEQRLGAADPAALAEVLERVERREQVLAVTPVLDLARRSRRATAPSRARRAAWSTRLPMPIDALCESMISIGVAPSSALAATCADCIVAESARRQVDADDPVGAVVAQTAERLLERADRRRRGLRQDATSSRARARTRRRSAPCGRRTRVHRSGS